MPVAVVGVPRVEDREAREIVCSERHLAEAFGLRTDQPDRPAYRAVGLHGLHPHGLVEQGPAQDQAGFQGGVAHVSLLPPAVRSRNR